MFSERAKSSLENLLDLSLDSALSGDIARKTNSDRAHINKDRVIVLTISSYNIRFLILIFYSEDNALKNMVAEKTKTNLAAVNTEKIQDYMQEIGNAVCGSMKRELGNVFQHLGMSTPYILDLSSLDYIERLNFEHDFYRKVISNNGAEIFGGIAVSGVGDIDFVISKQASIDEDAGELEMF